MRSPVCLVVLAICALAAGCHPRPPSRVRTLGDRLAALHRNVAPAVTPMLTNLDIKAVAKVRPAARPVEAPPPAQSTSPEPAPAPAPEPMQASTPAPTMTITRVNAARPTVFVLRGTTHGGKAFCESHQTSDACNARCTSMLRVNAFQQPEPSTPTSCSCLEQDGGC